MSILEWCQWLQAVPWAAGIKESEWQFPLLESVHTLALATMVWPAAILDLRLLGVLLKKRTVSQVASQFLPWVWAGFAVMAATGVVLFASEAVKCYNSPFFRVKVILIGLAGLNAAIFHNTVYRNVAVWDANRVTPFRARVTGALSLTFWVGVVIMGRGLAYA